MDSSATPLTGHLVARIKRHISPNTSPRRHANTLRPGAIGKTCKIYWKTKQDSQDRSTDHGGVPQDMTMTVTPDTINQSPARPNTIDRIHLNYVGM